MEPDGTSSSGIGLITLNTKEAGKPSAGKQHAGFDAAGAGNHFTVQIMRHSQRKRRDPARLNLRSMAPVLDPTAAAAGAAHCGLQSAPQCLVKGGQQERQGGCAQAGRVVTHWDVATGLPRGKWTTDATRVGAQLSDHQQRFDARDESIEGAVSRLGNSLCRHPGLCCALSRGMVKQDSASRRAATGGAALSTAGWIADLAAKRPARVFDREPET